MLDGDDDVGGAGGDAGTGTGAGLTIDKKNKWKNEGKSWLIAGEVSDKWEVKRKMQVGEG